MLSMLTLAGCAQKAEVPGKPFNTLLWRISGNGLEKASYLFGTIHMLCADDAVLSPNMKKAIRNADEVYLEVDMDNFIEMLGVMSKMKMTGDTTLRDLLSSEDYELVKDYFDSRQSLLPFSMLETFKPILAASTLEQAQLPCDKAVALEQVIMQEAMENEIEVSGLETMGYQASMLDSIPYRYQAEQLVAYIRNSAKGGENTEGKEMQEAYNSQDLEKLEALIMKSDAGIASFADILLYNRNRNWVQKLKDLLPGKSLVIAVGAGHLPGEQGVINLLKKEGYTVEPVENRLTKTKTI